MPGLLLRPSMAASGNGFTEFQETFMKNAGMSCLPSFMRRCMMRIALAVAHRDGEQALITGESFSRAGSQLHH